MPAWYQQSLTPPAVLEVRLVLGLIPERDHAQAMVEVLDPTTHVQIAQWSAPHVSLDSWYRVFEEAVQKAQQYVGDAIEPF